MKLLHGLSGLVAVALVAAPALAEPAPIPYAIAFLSDAKPVTVGELSYPSAAGVRRMSGSCDVRMDISATGATSNVEVTKCSAEIFRPHAMKAAAKMDFGAGSTRQVKMEIRWTLKTEKPALMTASN